MSQWYSARVTVAMGARQQPLEKLLAKAAVGRPELAKRLARIDWQAVITQVAVEALNRVASVHKAKFEKAPSGRAKKDGVIGTISQNKTRLDVSVQNGAVSFSWSERRESYSGSRQDPGDKRKRAAWQKAFEEAYREIGIAAAFRIVTGSEVETQVRSDGATVLTARIKEGG